MTDMDETISSITNEIRDIKRQILELQQIEHRLYNKLMDEIDTVFMKNLSEDVLGKASGTSIPE